MPSLETAVRRIERRLVGRDKGVSDTYYESDPIEAMLHEIGHAVTLHGLSGAARLRAQLRQRIHVGDLCSELNQVASDRNEAETLPWTFLVAAAVEHPVDERRLVWQAQFHSMGMWNRDRKWRLVVAMKKTRKVQQLAARFVRMLRKEMAK